MRGRLVKFQNKTGNNGTTLRQEATSPQCDTDGLIFQKHHKHVAMMFAMM